jgi:hypothetical protein
VGAIGHARVPNDCGVSLSPDIGAYQLQRTFACPVSFIAPSNSAGLAGAVRRVPLISAASISASLHARRGKHARPGKLLFSLNEAAAVTITMTRLTAGHLRKKACVAKKQSNACKRLMTVNVTHGGQGRAGMPSRFRRSSSSSI